MCSGIHLIGPNQLRKEVWQTLVNGLHALCVIGSVGCVE